MRRFIFCERKYLISLSKSLCLFEGHLPGTSELVEVRPPKGEGILQSPECTGTFNHPCSSLTHHTGAYEDYCVSAVRRPAGGAEVNPGASGRRGPGHKEGKEEGHVC